MFPSYISVVCTCATDSRNVLLHNFACSVCTRITSSPLLFVYTTAVVLNTPGGVVTEGDLVGYSCTFPCTHSLIAWRVGEDLVIDNNRLSLQGFDRRLRQSGITEASIDVISSCSDSTETGTSRLGIRVTTQLDGTPIQCEALPRDDTSGNSNLYSIFSILRVQPKTVTSTAASEPSPTPSLSSSTCVCAPSYTTISVGTTPSVSVTPSPAPCPSTTPGMLQACIVIV